MAKGNLFLGTARGSIGDVTFYGKNGQQISRVRKRSIRNPQSEGQIYQRAILATVAKAYQAGSEIFDHSFQGVSVGAASQARFMKENINLIRSFVEDDITNVRGEDASTVALLKRGSVWPAANAYRISQGSLPQTFITIGASDLDLSLSFPPASGENQTVAQWLQAAGIIDDDIFTICSFFITGDYTPGITDQFKTNWPTTFGFVRLRVRTVAVTSTALVSSARVVDVFEISSNVLLDSSFSSGTLVQGFLLDSIFAGAVTGSVGVIRSRENSGERSTSDMVFVKPIAWGVIPKYILSVWFPEVAPLGDSQLILEGGGFPVEMAR